MLRNVWFTHSLLQSHNLGSISSGYLFLLIKESLMREPFGVRYLGLRIYAFLVILACCSLSVHATISISDSLLVSGSVSSQFGASIWINDDRVFVGAPNNSHGSVYYAPLPLVVMLYSLAVPCTAAFGTQLAGTDLYLFATGSNGPDDMIAIYSLAAAPILLDTVLIPAGMRAILQVSPDQTMLLAASTTSAEARLFDINSDPSAILTQRGLDFDLDDTPTRAALSNSHVFFGWYMPVPMKSKIVSYDVEGRSLRSFLTSLSQGEIDGLTACEHMLFVSLSGPMTYEAYTLSFDLEPIIDSPLYDGASKRLAPFAVTPTCSYYAMPLIAFSGPSVIQFGSFAMNSLTQPVKLGPISQTTCPKLGAVSAISDSWLVLASPDSDKFAAIPVCPLGTKYPSPLTTGDWACQTCPSGVTDLSDVTDCSAIDNTREDTGGTNPRTLAVAGNTFVRGDKTGTGQVEIGTVDSLTAMDGVPIQVVGTSNEFGAAVATNGRYVVVGANDNTLYVFDVTLGSDTHNPITPIFPISGFIASVSELGKNVAIHPTKLIIAATATFATQRVVVVFHGTSFSSLNRHSPPSGSSDPNFGDSMFFTENYLIVGNEGDNQAVVYSVELTAASSLYIVHTSDFAGQGGSGMIVGGTDKFFIQATRLSSTMYLSMHATDGRGIPSTLSSATVSAHPALDCDTLSGMCALASDEFVRVYDLETGSPNVGSTYTQFDLSTSGTISSISQVGINTNSFVVHDASTGQLHMEYTECQTTMAGYSPAFRTCDFCPQGWYSPKTANVACKPVPFGERFSESRMALLGMEITLSLAYVYMTPTAMAAKNHVLALTDGSELALFDVDFAGLHGHGPFLTKPSSVGSSVFGSAVAVTESGHVIVGSPTASGVAHGISIFELTHDSAVYVRSFFKYVPNCEYGDSIATHGDYVAVSAPGSACEAVDVYNTADWTKASVTAADLSPPFVLSFATHIAIDADYLYASGVVTGNGIVVVLSGFEVPGATLVRNPTLLEPVAFSLPVTRLIADPLTETLFVGWDEASAVYYGVYRRGSGPPEAVMEVAFKAGIGYIPMSVSYFNGEIYTITGGQYLSATSNLLDTRTRSVVSNSVANSDFNGYFTFLDGLPIIQGTVGTNAVGVLLPTYSEAGPGEEMLGPGYFRPCPDGYYSPGHQALCTKCPPHYASNTDHTACVPEYTVSTVDPGVAVTAISTYKDAMAAVSYTEGCGTDTGSVFLHEYDGTAWTLTETLTPPASGCVGLAVAINDDWLAVSSEFNYGLVLVYSRSTLDLTASLTPADAGTGFGWSLALAGDSLLVGAPTRDDGVNSQAGVVHRYKYTQASAAWTPRTPDIVSSSSIPNGHFGSKIATKEMPDRSVAIAVSQLPSPGFGSVFLLNTVTWQPQYSVSAAFGDFGVSVSVLAHDEFLTSMNNGAVRMKCFSDGSVYAYRIKSGTMVDFAHTVAAFGDQVLSSATSYSLYGHETGAFAVSGFEPTIDDMSDVGYLLPPSERLVDSMGFGQFASTRGSGVMFATDAQSTAITCIHPTCTAGQHADTWYSCADCPPYTVGDGQTCANETAITFTGVTTNVYSMAVSGELALRGSPDGGAGSCGVTAFIWSQSASDWMSSTVLLTDDFTGDNNKLGHSMGLSDDWLVVSGQNPSTSKGITVVYARFGVEFVNPSVLSNSMSNYPPLVAASGDLILHVDPDADAGMTTISVRQFTNELWSVIGSSVSMRAGVARSVAMDGARYAVGFPAEDIVQIDFDNGGWGSETDDITITAAGVLFGHTVAMEGSTLLVGAPGDNSGDGAMYAFAFDNGWTQSSGAIIPNDPVSGGAFPSSISLHDGHAAVGWTACQLASVTGCVLMFDIVSSTTTSEVWAQTLVYYDPLSPGVGNTISAGRTSIFTAGQHDEGGVELTNALMLSPLCAAGQYADTWYSCADCPAGTYSPEHSMSVCHTCPFGQTPNAAADGCVDGLYHTSFTADSPANDDGFGAHLSVSGDLVAVGSASGLAYLYQRQGFMASSHFEMVGIVEYAADPAFGSSAIALTNHYLAVTAPTANGVIVYTFDSQFKFGPPRSMLSSAGGFGYQLAADNTMLVIATLDNEVYVRKFISNIWQSFSKVKDWTSGSQFGAAVALTPTFIFVGAPGTNMVTVYSRADIAEVTTIHGSAGQAFGSTLAAVETASRIRVAVGCPSQVVRTTTGAVQVFEFDGSVFQPIGTAINHRSTLPNSLYLDDDVLLAGAPYITISGLTNAGAMLAFEYDGDADAWDDSGQFTATAPAQDDQVGLAAAAGSVMLAYSANPAGAPGKVFTTTISCPAGEQPATWHSCEPCPAGFVSEAGWSRCFECPSGYTANGDQTACDPSYLVQTIPSGHTLPHVVKVHGSRIFALFSHTGMNIRPQFATYSFDTSTESWVSDGLSFSLVPTSGTAFMPSFDVSGHWVAMGSPAESKVFVYSRSDASFDLLDTLTPDGFTASSYGAAVAMTDSILAVGVSDTMLGQVLVYSFSGVRWALQCQLRSSMASSGDSFGSTVAVAPDSSFIVAADPLADYIAVFNYTTALSGIVSETQFVQGTGHFGQALAATETTIAVGSPADTIQGVSGAGSVTLLGLDSTAWVVADTIATPYSTDEAFGSAVALTDTHVIVGAPEFYDGAQVGRVHVFAFDGSECTFEHAIPSSSTGTASFGSSVSATAQFIAAGSPHWNSTDGAVTIAYQPCNDTSSEAMTSWHDGCETCAGTSLVTSCALPRLTKLYTNPFGGTSSHFGHAIALSDEFVAVSTHFDDPATPNGVLVATLLNSDQEYSVVTSIEGSAGDFGKSLAINDRFLAVGASSSVEVYWRIQSVFTKIASVSILPAESSFGDTLLLWDDYLAIGAPAASVGAVIGAGVVVIYELTDSSAPKVTTVDLAGVSGRGADALGTSLLEHNGTLFIGAPEANTVFAVDESDWSTVTQVITATLPTTTGSFGSSMAYDDVYDLLLISDPDADMFGTAQGAVVAFELDADTSEWTQLTWIRSMYSDMTNFGQTLAASGGNLFAGSPDSSYLGSSGSLELVSFDSTSRQFKDIGYERVAGGDVANAASMLPGMVFFSEGTNDPVVTHRPSCEAGTFPVSFDVCMPCPAGTYAPTGSIHCLPCGVGYTPSALKDSCDSLLVSTSITPAADTYGDIVVVAGENLLISSMGRPSAFLYTRGVTDWVLIKEFSGQAVLSAAMDDSWLAIGTAAGAMIYRLDPRSCIHHTTVTELSFNLKMGIVNGKLFVTDNVNDRSMISEYNAATDAWDTLTTALEGVYGTSLAVHPRYFVTGDTTTTTVYPWPAECADYSTCGTDLGYSGDSAVLILDDLTIFTTSSSNNDIVIHINVGSESSPAWEVGQTLQESDRPEALAYSSGAVFAGIPGRFGNSGVVRILELQSSGVWVPGNLIPATSAESRFGAGLGGSSTAVVMGAPANTGAAAVDGEATIYTVFCSVDQYPDTFFSCADCPAGTVSSAGSTVCSPCHTGTVLSSTACVGDEVSAVLDAPGQFGSEIAIGPDLLMVGAEPLTGDLIFARYDPYDHSWAFFKTLVGALTDTSSRIVVTDDYILFGDPFYMTEIGRVGLIKRYGHIFDDLMYIDSPATDVFFGWQIDVSGDTLIASSVGNTLTNILMFSYDLPSLTAIDEVDYGDTCYNFAVYGRMMVCSSDAGTTTVYPDFADKDTAVSLTPTPDSVAASIVITDDLVLVGSPDDTSHTANDVSTGAVYVYLNDGDTYPLKTILTSGRLDSGNYHFGTTIAMVGPDTIAVGSPGLPTDAVGKADMHWFELSADRPVAWADGRAIINAGHDAYQRISAQGGMYVVSIPYTGRARLYARNCDAGFYPESVSACVACPAGTVSTDGAMACHTCPTGFEPNATQTGCVEIFEGKRFAVGGSSGGWFDAHEGLAIMRENVISGTNVTLFAYDTVSAAWEELASIAPPRNDHHRPSALASIITDEHIIVGGYGGTDLNPGRTTGAALIYDRWSLELVQQILPPDDSLASDSFSFTGTRVGDSHIILSDYHATASDGSLLAGAIHLYRLVLDEWAWVDSFAESGTVGYGWHAAARGSTVAVSTQEFAPYTTAGAQVFVYQFNGSTLTPVTSVTLTGYQYIGKAMDISPDEDTLAVACLDPTVPAADTYAVFEFNITSGENITVSEGTWTVPNSAQVQSLAHAGDAIYHGRAYDNGNLGSVVVYHRVVPGFWTASLSLDIPDAATDDSMGQGLKITDSGLVVVGMTGDAVIYSRYDCPVGEVATSWLECGPVPSGSIAYSNSHTRCLNGSYADNSTTCVPCNAGTYQPDKGATECLSADAGFFVPDDGYAHTAPIECPVATSQTAAESTSCTRSYGIQTLDLGVSSYTPASPRRRPPPRRAARDEPGQPLHRRVLGVDPQRHSHPAIGRHGLRARHGAEG
ncbi:FG-GAP repeat [Carpediemonas membranifera]|uniref:FG-GAP repeat n=1 Tax=Carpediemonas membranifera TaxID=201153 RepID=A0A8J6E8N5_9EUKA|nr:FG-GAP repeat [Carpediemonas membranifera]|eukprot:KAG9392170.1 FG-GAP repeat [Carpediemonas membranifera]